jgi:pyoverdine/dityrosine biosynthesis protein Dit1
MKNRVCLKVSIICLISSLPAHPESVVGRIPDQILSILKPFQITQDIDKKSISLLSRPSEFHSFDYKSLQEKIAKFLKDKKPLKFLLVGFPFKSANTEKKVLGQSPDMAERRSLEYLHGLIKSLKEVYPYGVELVIFCDGIPFCEYLGISAETVKLYEQGLQKLVQDMPVITLITSDSLQEQLALLSLGHICDVIDKYAPSDEEFHEQLSADSALQDSYTTLLGRLEIEFDSIKGREFLAKYGPLSKITKALMAREMRMRRFIESQFNAEEFIRLTVHYSKDLSKKFGIKFSPNSFVTPYHGVLVEEGDGNWFIRFRKDIDPQIFEEVSEVVNGLQCQYMRLKK